MIFESESLSLSRAVSLSFSLSGHIFLRSVSFLGVCLAPERGKEELSVAGCLKKAVQKAAGRRFPCFAPFNCAAPTPTTFAFRLSSRLSSLALAANSIYFYSLSFSSRDDGQIEFVRVSLALLERENEEIYGLLWQG